MQTRSLAIAFSVLTAPLAAQCSNPWTLFDSPDAIAGPVRAVVAANDGSLVIGGFVYSIGGVPFGGIARRIGTTWQPIGGGLTGGGFYTLIETANGDLVAGGQSFPVPGGPSSTIARWNGTAWSSLGSGTNGLVLGVAEHASGDLYAVGTFNMAGGQPCSCVARWNGTSWSPLGSGTNGIATAVLVRGNGDVIVGGGFTQAGGQPCVGLARWDGASWSALGGGTNATVEALAEDRDGALLAGGWFTFAGGVPANGAARWNGTSWSALGVGPGSGPGTPVYDLRALPDGDVVAGGGFAGRLSRFDGTSWSVLGSGTSDFVHAVTLDAAGSLWIGGSFLQANGSASPSLARIDTTCPPSDSPAGAGCSGSGGPNTLATTEPAWIGSTYRASASGFAPNSLAVVLFGFGQLAIPIAALLPEGVPGCTLWSSGDVLFDLQIAGSTLATAIPIPADQSIAGLSFFHQVIPVELAPNGSIAAFTATNALQVTIGAW
ncbi:MAG: hypothetical protein ACK5UQ_24495 [Planctomycetota bacterium]